MYKLARLCDASNAGHFVLLELVDVVQVDAADHGYPLSVDCFVVVHSGRRDGTRWLCVARLSQLAQLDGDASAVLGIVLDESRVGAQRGALGQLIDALEQERRDLFAPHAVVLELAERLADRALDRVGVQRVLVGYGHTDEQTAAQAGQRVRVNELSRLTLVAAIVGRVVATRRREKRRKRLGARLGKCDHTNAHRFKILQRLGNVFFEQQHKLN